MHYCYNSKTSLQIGLKDEFPTLQKFTSKREGEIDWNSSFFKRKKFMNEARKHFFMILLYIPYIDMNTIRIIETDSK